MASGLEQMIARSGPENFEAIRRGWFPTQDERQARELRGIGIEQQRQELDNAPQKRQAEQRQFDSQEEYKQLMIKDIQQKLSFAKTDEDRQILEGKETVLDQYTRGAKAILDEFGPQAARQYMGENINPWKDAAGDEQDAAMDKALAMDEQGNFMMADEQFSQALNMVYLGRPIVQDELTKSRARTRGEYFQLKDITIDGVVKPFVLNARTGALEPAEIPEGEITSAKYSPKVKRDLAEAGAAGKVIGKERATAKIDLPGIKSNANAITKLVEQILSHPAFSSVVGMPSTGKVTQFLPGTPEAGFRSLQKQLTGKQFVQQYQDVLKGGGQITEIEGQKATESYSRMTTALSEKEFREAASEFKTEVNRLVTLAEERATGKTSEINAPPAAIEYLKANDSPELREVFKKKYGFIPESF